MRNSLDDPHELAASYRWCHAICRKSQSSFYSSFRLLDLRRRKAMYALYAFARIVDDIGDSDLTLDEATQRPPAVSFAAADGNTKYSSQQHRSPQVQLASVQLASVQGELAKALQFSPPLIQATTLERTSTLSPRSSSTDSLSGDCAANLDAFAPLWPALAHAVESFAIPPQLLFDVVEGVRMDLHPVPPADWDELKRYCYHVASAVGLACVHIWKKEPLDQVGLPEQSAVDCGIAFQLTNILRDIAEDARAGRIYIPLSEMERFGVDPTRWLAGELTGDWTAMIDQVAAETRRLYVSGWPTIAALTPNSQRMFSLMWRSYHQLLEQVVANKHTLWGESKVRLSATTKLHLLTSHLVPQLFRRLPAP